MNKAKIVLAAFVWLIILAVGVGAWKLVIEPQRKSAERKQKQEYSADVVSKTQGTSKYNSEIAVGIDSFSGYAIFRSPAFQEQLAQYGVRVKLVDDNANYAARGAALENGGLQMALFPADALIKISAKQTTLPATIIAIVDETRGADAMVAYKAKFPDIDTLNHPETRFVMIGDSPSETLARVVMHDFDLARLDKQPFITVDSPRPFSIVTRRPNPTRTKSSLPGSLMLVGCLSTISFMYSSIHRGSPATSSTAWWSVAIIF